jgi:hypothetical protein
MLRLLDFYCKDCDIFFEKIIDLEKEKPNCPKCSKVGERSFPRKAPSFRLEYNPKKDVCDWDGNTSQFYRLYNEAKERGENVRLPEEGE